MAIGGIAARPSGHPVSGTSSTNRAVRIALKPRHRHREVVAAQAQRRQPDHEHPERGAERRREQADPRGPARLHREDAGHVRAEAEEARLARRNLPHP